MSMIDTSAFPPFVPDASDVRGDLAPLVTFRDFPSAASHLEAARLIYRLGPLAINQDVYSLVDGRVVITRPDPADQTRPR